MTDSSSLVDRDFKDEFARLVRSHALGKHESPLLDFLRSVPPAYDQAFEYGFDQLVTSRRPEKELATYFLVLSSLSEVSHNFRDLATDAMVFVENGDDSIPNSVGTALVARRKSLGSASKGRG